MDHRWYAIQTTAGHENKVRSLIKRRIEADPTPADVRLIRQALMPTQEVVEVKNGKKVTVERKLYPGYVLVEMVWNQETAHVINSIQGVIKFVQHGLISPTKEPMALRQDEVNRLLGIADEKEEEAPRESGPPVPPGRHSAPRRPPRSRALQTGCGCCPCGKTSRIAARQPR